MAIDSRTLAWATLAHKSIPQRVLVELLRAFGDPASVLAARRTQLAQRVGTALADAILAPEAEDEIDATVRWLDVPGHDLITWDDPDYPRALLDVGDAPPALFHVGRRDLLNRPALAIVGSRNATPQGVATAREFAAALCASGLLIVSGLAEGIDTAAHLGALDASADPAGGSVSAPGATPVSPTAGSTLAVIGTGPDRVYPARNRDLATRIAKCGALLSEYRPGTPARKENFPRRNRLISGLARGVLVVEASLSSGSLITARLAGEQGREVFAIPGSIHSPFSRGCHKLIRDGAKLVETAQDVLVELGMTPPGPGRAQTGPKAATNDETSVLLEAMGYDCVAADTLVLRTGLGAAQVTAGLTRLEIERQIAQVPGGYWQRTERRT